MPRRILQLICGVAAVSALAIAPAAAGAATATTTGGGSSNCFDHYPPHSWWGHGWHGHDGNGPYWRGWGDGRGGFGGGSYDSSCNALDRRGKVARVMVAVQRLGSSGCRNLHGTGHLSVTRDCGQRHWIHAHGTRHWHYSINRHLPRGRYAVYHRAYDKAGNRSRMHRRQVAIR
jgi:hypothetical protein